MDITRKPDTVGVDSNDAPIPEATGGPQEPRKPLQRRDTRNAPPEALSGPHSQHDEATTAHAAPADSKTAREKIANLLWWSVPSSTDEEAKARTEQLLDAFATEVLRVGADELDRVANEAEARVAAHYGPASGIGPGSADLVREAARMLRTATVGRTGQPSADAAPDFFQPGHTYADTESSKYDWKFRVDTITTHPENGERTALGWRHFRGEWEPYAYAEDDWDIHQHAGLTDVTEAGEVSS